MKFDGDVPRRVWGTNMPPGTATSGMIPSQARPVQSASSDASAASRSVELVVRKVEHTSGGRSLGNYATNGYSSAATQGMTGGSGNSPKLLNGAASQVEISAVMSKASVSRNPSVNGHCTSPVGEPSPAATPTTVCNGMANGETPSKDGVSHQPSTSLAGVPSSGKSSPHLSKPFKKRYLAEQVEVTSRVPAERDQPARSGSSGGVNGSSTAATPTPPSATPTPPISPDGVERARACEALLELSRPPGDETSSGSKDAEKKATAASSGSSSPRNGSVESTSADSGGRDLRQAVWKGVMGTLLSQQEKVSTTISDDKKKTSTSVANQCTIRSQQIIDHIIESILVQPSPSAAECGYGSGPSGSQPGAETGTTSAAKTSLNNNAGTDSGEVAGQDNSDRIKASIYESLKNDLLRNVTSNNGAKAANLPFNVNAFKNKTLTPVSTKNSAMAGRKASPVTTVSNSPASQSVSIVEVKPVGNKLAAEKAASPKPTPQQQQQHSPASAVVTCVPAPGPSQPPFSGGIVVQTSEHVRTTAGGAQLQRSDILRLVGKNNQLVPSTLPMNIGHSSVTITRTPKVVVSSVGDNTNCSTASIHAQSPTVMTNASRTVLLGPSNPTANLSPSVTLTLSPVVSSGSGPSALLSQTSRSQPIASTASTIILAQPRPRSLVITPAEPAAGHLRGQSVAVTGQPSSAVLMPQAAVGGGLTVRAATANYLHSQQPRVSSISPSVAHSQPTRVDHQPAIIIQANSGPHHSLYSSSVGNLSSPVPARNQSLVLSVPSGHANSRTPPTSEARIFNDPSVSQASVDNSFRMEAMDLSVDRNALSNKHSTPPPIRRRDILTTSECGAVNLTVSKPQPGPERIDSNAPATPHVTIISPHVRSDQNAVKGSLHAHVPVTVEFDDESAAHHNHLARNNHLSRSSSRSCKGKRYQEFIEDGRINISGARKRRSHKSGGGTGGTGESEDEATGAAAVNLTTSSAVAATGSVESSHQIAGQPTMQDHSLSAASGDISGQANGAQHWKKKYRTSAGDEGRLGENGNVVLAGERQTNGVALISEAYGSAARGGWRGGNNANLHRPSYTNNESNSSARKHFDGRHRGR